MARGNGDAANTKPCSSCLVNRVATDAKDPMCSDCRKATDRLLKDIKNDD